VENNIVDINERNIATEAAESVHTNVPFSIIENDLIQNSNLTPESRMLIIYLLSFGKGWVFYDSVIRKNFKSLGRDKLRKMFRELKEEGYIKVVPLRDPKGKVLGSKRIFSKFPEFLVPQEPTSCVAINRDPEKPPLGESTETPENQRAGISARWRTTPNKININNKKDLFKNTNKKINKKRFDVEFEEFWKLYPKKVDKHKSSEAYNKLLQEDYGLHALIMSAVLGQVQERAIKEKLSIWQPEPKLATAWLNAKRWEDEIKTEEQLKHEEDKRVKPGFTREPSRAEKRAQVQRDAEERAMQQLREATLRRRLKDGTIF
jgi:hypothetical protein